MRAETRLKVLEAGVTHLLMQLLVEIDCCKLWLWLLALC